jgi:hypothetical protein
MAVNALGQTLLLALSGQQITDLTDGLKAGDLLKGRVVDVLPPEAGGNPKAVVNLRGINVVAELQGKAQILAKGDLLQVQVTNLPGAGETGQSLNLQLMDISKPLANQNLPGTDPAIQPKNSQPNAIGKPAEELLAQMRVPVTRESLAAVRAFMALGISPTAEKIDTAVKSAQMLLPSLSPEQPVETTVSLGLQQLKAALDTQQSTAQPALRQIQLKQASALLEQLGVKLNQASPLQQVQPEILQAAQMTAQAPKALEPMLQVLRAAVQILDSPLNLAQNQNPSTPVSASLTQLTSSPTLLPNAVASAMAQQPYSLAGQSASESKPVAILPGQALLTPQTSPSSSMPASVPTQASPNSTLPASMPPQARPNSTLPASMPPQASPNSTLPASLPPQASPNSTLPASMPPQASPSSTLPAFAPMAFQPSSNAPSALPQANASLFAPALPATNQASIAAPALSAPAVPTLPVLPQTPQTSPSMPPAAPLSAAQPPVASPLMTPSQTQHSNAIVPQTQIAAAVFSGSVQVQSADLQSPAALPSQTTVQATVFTKPALELLINNLSQQAQAIEQTQAGTPGQAVVQAAQQLISRLNSQPALMQQLFTAQAASSQEPVAQSQVLQLASQALEQISNKITLQPMIIQDLQPKSLMQSLANLQALPPTQPLSLSRQAVVEATVFLQSRNLPTTAAFVEPVASALSLQKPVPEILQELEQFASKTSLQTSASSSELKQALNAFQKLNQALTLNPEKDALAQQIKTFTQQGGFSLEARLTLPEAEAKAQGRLMPSTDNDLKASLLNLQHRALEAKADASLSTQARTEAAQVAKLAHDALATMTTLQLASQSVAGRDTANIQVPVWMGQQVVPGKLTVYWRQGKEGKPTDQDPVHMVFLLNTRALKDVRVSLAVYEKDCMARIDVSDPDSAAFIKPRLKELQAGFSANTPYRLKSVDLGVAESIAHELSLESLAAPASMASGLSLTA